jgi:hypothetical protein
MAHVTALMNQLTTVERVARTSDGGGGFTEVWSAHVSSVKCRGFPFRARATGLSGAIGGVEEMTSERPGVQEFTVVLVQPTVDATEGDRLTEVTDRRGNVVFSGPMYIDSVGEEPDHHRLVTRKIT